MNHIRRKKRKEFHKHTVNELSTEESPGVPNDARAKVIDEDSLLTNRGGRPFDFETFHKYKLDEDIHLKSSHNKFDVTVMAMHYAMRHSLTNEGTEDLMKMLNTILGYDALPDSMHRLNKLFLGTNKFEYHYYCSKCIMYLGEAQECEMLQMCKNNDCQTPFSTKNKNNGNYFIYIPMEQQIRQLLEEPGISDILVNVEEREVDDNKINDIFDGLIYKELIKSGVLNPKNTLTITVDSDGSAVQKACKNSLWPIQFRLNELIPRERLSPNRLMTAALWFGSSDPVMTTFFVPVILDAQKMHKDGVTWVEKATGEQKCTKILTVGCIADTVGRAKLQNIMQFNGHFGCAYCLHPGESINNAMKYKCEHFAERTNEGLRGDMLLALISGSIIMGAKGLTPFFPLEYFNVSWGFPIDFMHNGLLGVEKFLFSLWFDSTMDKPYHVPKDKQEEIDKILLSMRPPSNISRMPRSIFEDTYWKASEWRSFLLFYSIICLKGFLEGKYFDHFCLFVAASFILLQDEITKEDLDLADKYLNKFVDDFADLYGEESMRYNVHLLTHLARNVYLWGPLWTTSAFCFETGNGNLMDLISGTRAIADQIAKRYIFFSNISNAVCGNYLTNQAAEEYCISLMSYERLKVSSKCGEAAVAGKYQSTILEESARKALQNFGQEYVGTVSRCDKIIYNGFILSADKGTTKFNDSLVQLTNGEYYKIIYFFKNPSDEKTLLFLGKKLNLSEASSTGGEKIVRHIKACKLCYTFDDFSVNEVKSIKCKSIFMCSEKSGFFYVSNFPNFYEKD